MYLAMSRSQQTFKQCDVTKALKATVKAGIAVERIEIEKTGTIVIVTKQPYDTESCGKEGNNEWDGVLR